MNEGLLNFLIHWLPTILFLVGLLLTVGLAALRGFRKSLILWIQAIALAVIFLIIFLSIAGKNNTDPNVFKIISTFVGKDTIQNAMGVSESCQSFTECFIEYIPKSMNFNDGWKLVLQENGQYLATLADMAARMIIALFLWIFYGIGIFLLYIIYLIFYPQRRHEKKLEKNYYSSMEKKRNAEAEKARQAEEEANASITPIEEPDDTLGEDISPETMAILNDESEEEEIAEEPVEEVKEEPKKPEKLPPFRYKKRRLFGMLVGGARGLVEGLVFLSFIGGIYFILAGGNGNREVTKIDWEDSSTNLTYEAYTEIATYGTEGMYKVLNAFHDKENTPYYLFAVDLVFRGGLVDENRNVNENIYLRKEFSALTAFGEDTFDLLMKYGAEEIRDCARGKTEEQMTDVVIGVMAKEGFREDFLKIIDGFKASTYFVNLSFSFINSFVNHIEELNLEESLGENTIALIQLLFKKGYYCDSIAYEKYLKDTNSNEILPYMTPEMLFNKADIINIYNMFMEFVEVRGAKSEDSTKDTLDTITRILPYISKFTILSKESEDTMNGVLSRLYVFCQNTYFEDMTEDVLVSLHSPEEVENPYATGKYANVNWISEIRGLITVISDLLTLYVNGYEKDASVLENIFNIFNTENSNYAVDIELYDEITDTIGGSFLLGDIFASNFGSQIIENGLKSFVPELALPEINYSNVTNEDGTVTKGEFYWLLRALKAFGENQDNKALISKIMNGELSEAQDYYDLVGDLAGALTKKTTDESVLSSILKSTIFSCVIGEYLCTMDMGSFSIYVDESLLRKDANGNTVHRITDEELESFFVNVIDMLTVVKDIDFDTMSVDVIIGQVITEKFYNSLDSKIIEGTVSNLMANLLGDNSLVVIPQSLKDKTGYLTKNGENSEIRNLIGLYKYPHLNIATIIKDYADSSTQLNSIVGMLKQLSEEDMNAMFASKILYYSLSGYIMDNRVGFLGDSDLIVPDVAQTELPTEPAIDKAIDKAVLIDFLLKANKILPEDMSSLVLGSLVNSVVSNTEICENIVLSATMTNVIANGSNVSDVLIIPAVYKEAGKKETIQSYTNTNPWYSENVRFFTSLCSLIDLDTRDDGISVTDSNFANIVYQSFNTLNDSYRETGKTRLEVTYASDIMAATLSNRIDEVDILSDTKRKEVKNGDIYYDYEIAGLVDLINVFSLDLSNTSVLDSAMSNVTILTKPYAKDPSITNLHHLYEDGKISGLIITEGVEKVSAVPADAYITGELYVTENEAYGLLSSLDTLGLSLTGGDFVFDGNMSVDALKSAMFEYESDGTYVSCKSLILEINVSDQLVSYSDTVIVPASDYETTYTRIKPTSVYLFLNSLQALGGSGMKLDADMSNTNLPSDDDSLNTLASSNIFNASLTKNMSFEMDGVAKGLIEENKEVNVTTEKIYDNSSTVVIMSKSEVIATIKAYKVISPDSSMTVTFTKDSLKAMSASDRAILYESCMMRCILSDLVMDYGYSLMPGATPAAVTESINIKDYLDIDSSYELLSGAQIEEYIQFMIAYGL